jgi:DNA-binding NtrC family response regulator
MSPQVPSLLITDDDFDFRHTLRDVFEPRGFRILLARDGEEALELVGREPVHVILLDMHMPRLSGLETLRRVKQTHERLPCILISADMDSVLAEEAHRARAFSVLSKPVRFADVTGTVQRALESYGWTRLHQV